MTIRNILNLVDAELNGQTFFSTFRKTPGVATGTNIWFDLSMSPGNPSPNNWPGIPYQGYPLAYSTSRCDAIPHGGNVAPLQKVVKAIGLITVTAAAVPLNLILCDYLMSYTDIEMSMPTYVQQTLTTPTPLPRYADGRGVRIMAVVLQPPLGAGNAQFMVSYTNSDGVSGRLTPPVACGTQVVQGTIINTGAAIARCSGPFLPWQAGDSGVRSIEGITFLSQDVGLLALALVMPVENIMIRTIDAPVERVPVTDFNTLPDIVDDAFLGFICCPAGSLSAAPIHGYIQTVWG
jgi:hypothetical protein